MDLTNAPTIRLQSYMRMRKFGPSFANRSHRATSETSVVSGITNTAIHNEQLKLAATAFNNFCVAFVVTGVIAPTVALAYQVSTPHGGFWSVFVVLWLTMGFCSHLIGRYILNGMKP